MAKLLKLRRGTTTQHASFTGAEGEVTIDTTKDTAVVHDGSQAGGRPLLREDMANLPAGTIDNADVNASAAISGTKISPDFGSQDITTTGKIKFANVYATEGDLPSASTYHGMFAHVHATGLAYYAHGGNWIKLAKLNGADFTGNITTTGTVTATGNRMTISGTDPALVLTDNESNPDYEVRNQNSVFRIFDVQANSSPLVVNGHTDGHMDINVNADFASGIDVTGNITCTGTVDGRDVATDGSKLDGIEASATGDQTAAEIRTLVGTASDSNVLTDALKTKLDGIEASATADQTASEIVALINGQAITPLTVYTGGSGAVGFSGNDKFTASANTHIDVVVNGSNEFRFKNNGDFHADGDVIAFSSTISSDEKLKENIEVIPNALDKVEALNGVSFTWKRDGTPSAGVIAQDVQKVLPEAVKEVTPVKGGDSHLSVNYHALTSILIESIKELKAEIEELKGGK